MALTFLQAVNLVFKRAGIVAGDTSAITSFTDDSLQLAIDRCTQIWNEALQELFILKVFPIQVKQGSITLVTDQQSYSLASDFESMAGNTYENRIFKCAAKNLVLYEYPGGYVQLYRDRPNFSNYNGQPQGWAIDPTQSLTVYTDTLPKSGQNGDVYTYLYNKTILLSTTTDTFPFSDTIVYSLVPAVADLLRISNDAVPREGIAATTGFKRAVLIAKQDGILTQWGVRRETQSESRYFQESV